MANEFKVKNGLIAPQVTTPSITSENNANIAITPNGSGKVQLDGLFWPTADGTNGYVLQTDGAGNLTWAAQTGGGGGGGGSLTGSVVLNSYTGTGSQTAFVLSTTPAGINYTTVNINGVTQVRITAYTLSGSTITFTEAPPLGVVIEVVTLVTQAASAPSVRTVTTSGSILSTDTVVLASGTITLTLPTAVSASGTTFQVKNIGTGEVTLQCTAAQTIDGVTPVVMRYRNSALGLTSDGTNWRKF
jgi:hypothetical protein